MVMSFQKWLSEQIQGEYWIDNNGQIMGADGDTGDYNHEGHVMDLLQREIAEQFGIDINDLYIDWEEIKQKIVKEIITVSSGYPKILQQQEENDIEEFITKTLELDDTRNVK